MVYLWLWWQLGLQPEALGALQFAFLLMQLVVIIAAGGTAVGSPAVHYTRPLPTWLMVAWQLLLGCAAVAVMYASAAASVNLLAGAQWSIAGPILFCVASFACVQAVIWATAGGRRLQNEPVLTVIVLVPFCSGLLWWMKSRFPINREGIMGRWSELAWGDAAGLLAVLAASFVVAVIGIRRDRRGDAIDWGAIWRRLGFRPTTPALRRPPFRSAADAQFWFEWKPKGVILPTATAVLWICGMVGLAASLLLKDPAVRRFQWPSEFEFLVALTGLTAIGLPTVVGFVLGHLNLSSTKLDMSTFLAARPVGDDALARSVLKTATVSLAAAWLVCLLGAGCGYAAICHLAGVDVLRNLPQALPKVAAVMSSVQLPLLLAGAVLASWSGMAATLTLTLLGRERVLLGVMVGGVIFSILGLILLRFFLPPSVVSAVRNTAAVVLGVSLTIGTLAAYAAALRRRYVGAAATGLAGIAWLASSAAAILALRQVLPLPVAASLLTIGLLALPILPFAAAPLAIAQNRHR
jgi:hypothetical protein